MSGAINPTREIPVPESINLAWEMGLRKISDQIEVLDALDSKTGLIVGFVVVSIVEILGFLLLAAAEATKHEPSVILSRGIALLFVLGLLLSLLSTVLGFMALRVREFAIGFDYPQLVSDANLPEKQLKARFLDDLVRSVQLNKGVLEEKVRYARAATRFAVVGLICYTIVVVSLTVAFVRWS